MTFSSLFNIIYISSGDSFLHSVSKGYIWHSLVLRFDNDWWECELINIVCDICILRLLRAKQHIWHVMAIFYYPIFKHCLLNYLYLNLLSPFNCSSAIMSTIKYILWNKRKISTFDGSGRIARQAKKECIMIGEWPDMQRECASDWLICSSEDIERSCSLLVHVPSSESCYRIVVSAKYYYYTLVDVSPLLCLMFMTLFKNIQWNSRTFQDTRTQNSRTFRPPVATTPGIDTQV